MTTAALEREAEAHRTMAIRLFKSRAEVKDDYHWRLWRRRDIRSHLYQYREILKKLPLSWHRDWLKEHA